MIPSICDGRPFYDRFHLLPKFYATSEMFEQVENLRNFDGGRIDVDVFFNILYDKC